LEQAQEKTESMTDAFQKRAAHIKEAAGATKKALGEASHAVEDEHKVAGWHKDKLEIKEKDTQERAQADSDMLSSADKMKRLVADIGGGEVRQDDGKHKIPEERLAEEAATRKFHQDEEESMAAANKALGLKDDDTDMPQLHFRRRR